jgi:cytochrome d ubiquinol oxidase subunit I
MILVLLLGWWVAYKKDFNFSPLFYKILFWGITLPVIANATGWIFTEMGRQPWTVFGIFRIEDSVSKATTTAEVLFTMIGFTVLYGVLLVPTFYLWRKFAIKGTESLEIHESKNSNN